MADHDTHDHTGVPGVGTAGGIAASIMAAKGDILGASANDTPAVTTVGANDTILMADSAQSTGLKWVASATPTTQDYDDVASAGTADTFSRGDHLHGMPSASGGGGGTVSYLGYNTVGGTEETATYNRMIAKRITAGADGLLLAIGAYFRETSDSLQSCTVALFDDNATALGKFLASAESGVLAPTNNATFGGGTASVARWLATPITYALANGTSYWLGIMWHDRSGGGSSQPRMFYDGSGADIRYDSGGAFIVDGGRYTITDTTRRYSIRGLFLS